MHTRAVAFVAFMASLLAAVHGWSRVDDYDNWSPSRRSWCVGSGGKCYATDQCCKGFVCAAFDDLFEGKQIQGLNPETPGYCVREKDLEPCVTSSDCSGQSKCLSLGRAKNRYCVPHPDEFQGDEPSDKTNAVYAKPKSGLGMACKDDGDCEPLSRDGKTRLCCQEVRRYRQKAKKMCDRVTSVSTCIPSRK